MRFPERITARPPADSSVEPYTIRAYVTEQDVSMGEFGGGVLIAKRVIVYTPKDADLTMGNNTGTGQAQFTHRGLVYAIKRGTVQPMTRRGRIVYMKMEAERLTS